ncbi:MAG: DUF1465 family protein [Rhodospirillales bacterium]|nr:DUF1465 family protein [Rhodospirillales bacterium]
MMRDMRNTGSNSTVDFFARFSSSEQFERVFKQGMSLVEETANYLDGEGRTDSRALDRNACPVKTHYLAIFREMIGNAAESDFAELELSHTAVARARAPRRSSRQSLTAKERLVTLGQMCLHQSRVRDGEFGAMVAQHPAHDVHALLGKADRAARRDGGNAIQGLAALVHRHRFRQVQSFRQIKIDPGA